MGRIQRLAGDVAKIATHPRSTPIRYFDSVPNAGDLLNPWMIPRITGRRAFRPTTSRLPHLLAIGSILHHATPQSHVWGAGSLGGRGPGRGLDPARVFALRGERTLELLRARYPIDPALPLGDPGLLMPRFFDPEIAPDTDIGIVAHHSETDIARRITAAGLTGVRVLDIGQPPEPFIRELKRCRAVLSSAMHGLILADAYAIPNLWITLSDRLPGGDWKFHDYYSTTTNRDPAPVPVADPATIPAAELAGAARVNAFTGDADALLAAFPPRFLRGQPA